MTKAVNLSHAGSEAMRGLLGNRSFDKAIFAIDANSENVQTGAAVDFCIKGIMYTLGIDAEIDISADVATTNTVATGYEKIFVFCVDAAGAYTVIEGDARLTADIDSGAKVEHWPENMGSDVAAFAAVKVKNATGSLFTLGITLLDAANVTDTYYDLSVVPENVPA